MQQKTLLRSGKQGSRNCDLVIENYLLASFPVSSFAELGCLKWAPPPRHSIPARRNHGVAGEYTDMDRYAIIGESPFCLSHLG
jgi:hypothetical protein